MAIDAATVRRVAHLARIKTPEDRLEPLAAELNGILAWIEQLNEVDVAGIEPMTSNVAQPMRLRDDVVTDASDASAGSRPPSSVASNRPARSSTSAKSAAVSPLTDARARTCVVRPVS